MATAELPASLASTTTEVRDETPISTKVADGISKGPGKYAVWLIAFVWTIPTFGLLITSFRPEDDIKSTGWWVWFT